jgi:predicted transcriptional regulator
MTCITCKFWPASSGKFYGIFIKIMLNVTELFREQISAMMYPTHRTSGRYILLLKKIFIYDQYIYKERGIIIKQTSVKELDEKDLEFVEALRSINVPRNVATMITYLANTDEVTSREIEMGTDLRQPEVSIGMRTLRQNNWVEEHDVKVDGKGRPMKVYKLNVPIEEIIKHYEEQKNSEAAQNMKSIQRLKDITAK